MCNYFTFSLEWLVDCFFDFFYRFGTGESACTHPVSQLQSVRPNPIHRCTWHAVPECIPSLATGHGHTCDYRVTQRRRYLQWGNKTNKLIRLRGRLRAVLSVYRFRFRSFWRATSVAGGAGGRPSGCDGGASGATGAAIVATSDAANGQSRGASKRRQQG